MNKETRQYGLWDPLLTPEEIYMDIIQFADIFADEKGQKYWAEVRPAEDGRIIVVQKTQNGTTDVTPSDFNVRTRVHEYGGRAFTVRDDIIYFSNFKDQRLYKYEFDSDSAPVALTPERLEGDSLGKYAVPIFSPDGRTLIFVLEKEFEDKENENYLAVIDLDESFPQEPVILVSGGDFYGEPILSSDGRQIAWIQWNHPRMPWEGTELWKAEFHGDDLSIESAEKVAGDEKTAICYPKFDPTDQLFFIMDEAGYAEDQPRNWWNIYVHKNGNIEPITEELAEFGTPMWGLGYNRYVFAEDEMYAICHKKNGDSLAKISLDTKEIEYVELSYDAISIIEKVDDSNLLLLAASSDHPPAVTLFDAESEQLTVLKKSYNMPLKPEHVSESKTIEYPTEDGGHAYGMFYQPRNPNFSPPPESKPPLIVQVHGGPTSRASTSLSLEKQFWTSMGYAVLDVDHRGSIGYGRKFRDKLLGKWGIIDAKDVRDGIRYLQEQDMISGRIAIRGGSAGGYAVQRCLTMFPDLFSVGASYYGIGNLVTLVKLTHKFESRYLDSLLGASLEEDERVYKERSPINHIENLRAPMILFQGLDDKIVTPEVSQEIAHLLDEKGIKHEYVEYKDESHGFRKKETRIDALNKESQFYREVLFEA
ncbi:MAG: S9 family peptidase [Candidatus Thorarchaeota archaeon]|nr:S9 family peptidase [Candidatus Thorarchaeota archaeon]